MRHNRAPDSGDVAREEGNPGLGERTVVLLLAAELAVDGRHGALERRELDHRVRDLARPQRVKTLVQPAEALLLDDLVPAVREPVRVGRDGGLHADLDSLEGAEEDVGDELGGCGRAEVHHCLVGVGEQLLAVVVLEDFVRAVFARALERVAYEGRTEAEEDPFHALFGEDGAPGLYVRFVEVGVDLATAFYEIERSDGRVGGTASCEIVG